ncbi:MAG: DNA-directed RNA polymerase subunit beta', partial [Alphaproteobacteria bacterium]|nr:DNA-directed RNA polymerase subunit beta' [Alphaproteobacteria bacterium]
LVVIEPCMTYLQERQLLSHEEYLLAQEEYGEENFKAGIGAEALKEIMVQMDLEEMLAETKEALANSRSETKKKKLVKKQKLLENLISSNTRPEYMILDVLPIIPPELRPLVPLDGGRFASSDLNDLYRRVINRNNRLKRLLELKAPEIIIRNEKRMLQESVDALFDNGRRGRVITGTNKRPLKSISDMLKGKQGRFRQNLLGKRVDYSGRSVIVVGPELKIHQCGLPKKMALELFKPFIYHKLEAYDLAPTIKIAKKMVESERPEVWDILEEVIKEHPVLLNRAPTLHRLGVQAFEPILIEGKAIQLHPLVCAAFNADFDGDQMAVHVPLSLEAQLEARALMMSTNNILSPANGEPIIVPSQDMILGVYYITNEKDGALGEGMTFASVQEIKNAMDNGVLEMHAKIKCRYKTVDADGNKVVKVVDTTAGRMILSEIFPKHHEVPFSLINCVMTKKEVKKVIDVVYRKCHEKVTIEFCDDLKSIGFKYACKAGISIGKDDMIIPDTKWDIVGKAKDQMKELEQQYQNGLITKGEKYNKVVDVWSECSEEVAKEMMNTVSTSGQGKDMNAIYMMAHSGARGSATQIRQLAGMRGLMAKPDGSIIETPIIANFKEGLSVSEYFNSTHGARKGLADTALKTASSGYLTRRLVDAAQDCVVRAEDCGTTKSITARAVVDSGDIIVPLSEVIQGRVCAADVVNPKTEEVIFKAGDMIEDIDAVMIEKSGVDSVQIRSPLLCDCEVGVCANCYGRDLARGHKVSVGEAVGIIAAQSIGEPGTQLTMRTFHIGGAAQKGAEQSNVEAPINGKVSIVNLVSVVDSSNNTIVMNRNTDIMVFDEEGLEKAKYRVPYGSKLLVKDDEVIKKDQILAEWDPYTSPIIVAKDGIVKYEDLIEDISFENVIDDTTGIGSKIVSDWHQNPKVSNIKPRIVLTDDKGNSLELDNGQEAQYFMSVNAVLSVNNGDEVKTGDVIARIPREAGKNKDITGGLPRVAELFEARTPKDHALIAPVSGRIEFGKDYKTKKRLIVVPEDGSDAVECLVPKATHLLVHEGEIVEKGDLLMEGSPSPSDILNVMGIEKLAEYIVEEVQAVYRLQGVKINDKHIEVITRQMLQKVEILEGGTSTMLKGEIVDRTTFKEENDKVKAEGGKEAISRPVIQGITRASLQTKSFISAASFQETTRVLTEAAVQGKVDNLLGLKESIIVGRLIPAGTGRVVQGYKQLAQQKDKELSEKMQSEIESDIQE